MDVDHYEILGVDCTASPEAIKKAFKELALKFHPDKCDVIDMRKATEEFNKIVKSYEILNNEEQRSEYDAIRKEKLLTSKHLVNEEVSVSAMTYDKDSESYSLRCRCGGEYVVTTSNFSDDNSSDSCIVECDTCSLCIKLNKN